MTVDLKGLRKRYGLDSSGSVQGQGPLAGHYEDHNDASRSKKDGEFLD